MLAQTLPLRPNQPSAHSIRASRKNPASSPSSGPDLKAEPYLARKSTNIRRRLKRFLDAKPTQTKRLRLTERVARIEYTATGSDFESMLALYTATHQAFSERARKRLHLYASVFSAHDGQESLSPRICNQHDYKSSGRESLRPVPFARRRRIASVTRRLTFPAPPLLP